MSAQDQEERFNRQMGMKIRAARLEAGLVQGQLARLAGLSRASITNIEAGAQAPPPYRLSLIAQALKVETGSLLPSFDEVAVGKETMPQHLADALASVTSAAREIMESQHGES
ncbi:helix-turn-helix domain-containing protein [Nonomuraea fuscirosea]|uniref:helix-turn-helix domain-containing protein n=1 Tax=Nonomuraea fuscirosea TaxID=1291556 RepID=UPI0033F9FDDB